AQTHHHPIRRHPPLGAIRHLLTLAGAGLAPHFLLARRQTGSRGTACRPSFFFAASPDPCKLLSLPAPNRCPLLPKILYSCASRPPGGTPCLPGPLHPPRNEPEFCCFAFSMWHGGRPAP